MSWHCSQALVAEFSAVISLDGDVSAPSSTTPTPEAYYWPDKTTEHSRLSRFGMMSEPLTGGRGEELLMWYLAGFRARTSVRQEMGQVSAASAADFGSRWHGSFARYDRDTSSWKTAQCSLVEDLERFSETWPRWGSMRNGVSYQRQTPERYISENESGLWATPTTMDKLPPKSADALHREATIARPGRSKPANLRDQVSNMHRWPTPQVSDNRDRGNMSTAAIARRMEKGKQVMLSMCVSSENGRLNPDWVEWLMGWPIGLTDLKPLETAKFREWQQQHSLSLPADLNMNKEAA